MTEAPLQWSMSSFSGATSACIELAVGARAPVRNPDRPGAETLSSGGGELAPWVAGCTAGELGHLV